MKVSAWPIYFVLCAAAPAIAQTLPHVEAKGSAMQLIVDGHPFLMRGGEFSNKVYESPADLPYLELLLDTYKDAAINTLLVPISWRTLEPQEGTLDFRMIDTLIDQARRRELRIVVLWFGAIKNGGLHYAPRWVIDDKTRFFRALKPDGKEVYAVSPFCEAASTADRRTFIRLMQRIKERDPLGRTVIMIQPENETGCQEIDNDRDHSPAANRAWEQEIPGDLSRYLAAHDGNLVPWLQGVWNRNGKKTAGSWPQVFGEDRDGQKIFMSFYTGQFIERVASAGKAVHPLPMFLNDWLGSIPSPGGPIGGPEYHVMDLFRVTTPSVFAFAPDIYQNNFKEWLTAFHQSGNPILVPEANSDTRAAQQCWYTFFQHDGMLFSPYLLVPNESDQKAAPARLAQSNLGRSYAALREMEQIILAKQGLNPREMMALQLDRSDQPDELFQATIQGYTITAKASRPFPRTAADQEPETPGFAAIVKMAPDDFVVIGKTMKVEFFRNELSSASAERGQFLANQWVKDSGLPVDVTAGKLSVDLTNAYSGIDFIRLRFAARR